MFLLWNTPLLGLMDLLNIQCSTYVKRNISKHSQLENAHFYIGPTELVWSQNASLPVLKLSILIYCPANHTSKKYGPVTAIDVSPIALKLARRHSLHRLILADVNKPPFKQKFQSIIIGCLHHQ